MFNTGTIDLLPRGLSISQTLCANEGWHDIVFVIWHVRRVWGTYRQLIAGTFLSFFFKNRQYSYFVCSSTPSAWMLGKVYTWPDHLCRRVLVYDVFAIARACLCMVQVRTGEITVVRDGFYFIWLVWGFICCVKSQGCLCANILICKISGVERFYFSILAPCWLVFLWCARLQYPFASPYLYSVYLHVGLSVCTSSIVSHPTFLLSLVCYAASNYASTTFGSAWTQCLHSSCRGA